MGQEDVILYATLSMIGAIAASWLLTLWRDSKGKTSIYAADESMDDVAMSALSTLGLAKARRRSDGMIERRPPFGLRVLWPLIGAAVLYGMVESNMLADVGLTNPMHQSALVAGIALLLLYTAIMLNFVQKVVHDQTQIACYGVQLKPQFRKLDDLVDITVHDKRPALVLTFANQKRLYVPKALTGRGAFLRQMKSIAANNQAKGLAVPHQGLAAKMGF